MFLDEAEQFPTTKVHDDQVDAASQAFNTLFAGGFTLDDFPTSLGGYDRSQRR
jgi:phage terminase large subunit-like protein